MNSCGLAFHTEVCLACHFTEYSSVPLPTSPLILLFSFPLSVCTLCTFICLFLISFCLPPVCLCVLCGGLGYHILSVLNLPLLDTIRRSLVDRTLNIPHQGPARSSLVSRTLFLVFPLSSQGFPINIGKGATIHYPLHGLMRPSPVSRSRFQMLSFLG